MGAKTPSPTDRRVLRTRKALRDALIGLLLERGWDDTTVGKVCERAGVGRSTFYLHFADKEELLVGGFDDLRKALRAGVTPLAGPPLAFVRALIEHAGENQRLFRAIVGKRSGQTVLRRFRELVVDMVREDLAHSHPSGTTREAAVRFVAGALVELLTWWVEARTSLEVAAVERLFLQMANPALRAVPASTRR